jgi:hypothetical protein
MDSVHVPPLAHRDYLTGMIIPVRQSLSSLSKFKYLCPDTYMDVKELIEKTLNVKVVNLEEVKEKSFPLFDMVKVQGVKLALIKDPTFVVIEGEDVYERKVEGNFVIAEVNGKYVIASYTGEPNIEVLRDADSQNEEGAEEVADQRLAKNRRTRERTTQ